MTIQQAAGFSGRPRRSGSPGAGSLVAAVSGLGYAKIAKLLRSQIIEGRIPLGSRLPTRQQMARLMDTTTVTIQRALAQLQNQGFVEPRGRAGTWVNRHPPHLFNYAMVFRARPGDPPSDWTGHDTTFHRQASHLPFLRPGVRIEYFYRVRGLQSSEGLERLWSSVENRCLAGIIFVNPPYDLETTPILKSRLPRICMAEGPTQGVPTLRRSSAGFMDRALDELKNQGCRRIAVFASVQSVNRDSGRLVEEARAKAAARGMLLKSHWHFWIYHAIPQTARQVAQLLMDADPDKRPDGVVIVDDHLVEQVTLGLVDAGVQLSRDVRVVGMCNYPAFPPAAGPIRWLGYDVDAMLHQCFELLERQSTGKTVPPITEFSPLFEREMTSKQTSPFKQLEGTTP